MRAHLERNAEAGRGERYERNRLPEGCRGAWLDRRVVVAGGAGDIAAAGIGIGAVETGDAFVSLGTSAQFFVTDVVIVPSRARSSTPSRMRFLAAGSEWRRC